MTLRDLRELQELVFRAYPRDVMLFAALPYHLMQQEHCHRNWQSFSDQTKDPQ